MTNDALREAAEMVFRRARSEDSSHRVTLDTESLYELGSALFGSDHPDIVDLRNNIDAVNGVTGGQEITMGKLVDLLSEFPLQEEKP